MKLFSSGSVGFPGLPPAADSPPGIISEGSPADISEKFEQFAKFVGQRLEPKDPPPNSQQPPPITLNKAMYDNFISLLVDSAGKLPANKTLPEAIAEKYAQIKGQGDRTKTYLFHLYLYSALFHFSVYYCHKLAETAPFGEPKGVMNPLVRKFVEYRLFAATYKGGANIDPSFFTTDKYIDLFAIDMPLSGMLAQDGGLLSVESGHYKYIRKGRGTKKLRDEATALEVNCQFVREIRATINEVINSDVKRFLVKVAEHPSPEAADLLRAYGNFTQYALGDGGTTTGMFGERDFGLLFFNYEFDVGGVKVVKKDVPLLDTRDDAETAVCFLYYGVDNAFIQSTTGLEDAPYIQLQRYCDATRQVDPSGINKLIALDNCDHRPRRDGPIGPTSVTMTDFDERPDALKCSLYSSSKGNPEELVYIIFKHRIVHPQRQPPASPPIEVATAWEHLDNIFQKTAAEIKAEVFLGKGPELATLAAAILADPDFVGFPLVQGFGIGTPLNPVGPFGLRLKRDANQNDRAAKAGEDFDKLRYAHGVVRWLPRTGATDEPWLIFDVRGFVSPLRCTWDVNFTGTKKTDLDANIKPYVTSDQNGPCYNSVLSAFRAFALFENMVERLRAEIFFADDNSDPTLFTTISDDLDALLSSAKVRVLLPTGVYMKRPIAPNSSVIGDAVFEVTEIRSYY